MGDQASVHSIDRLRAFRVALTLFGEDALGALGAVEMEVRRTVLWLQNDRPIYWQDQLKRRREAVAAARAEVARRRLAKTPDYHPAMSEQKEILRKAEARLQDAEMRATLVKKWGPALQLAVLEYHASIRRIKDLASSDVPRAAAALERMIDALEAYLRIAVPSGAGTVADVDSAALKIMDEVERENLGAAPGVEENHGLPPADIPSDEVRLSPSPEAAE